MTNDDRAGKQAQTNTDTLPGTNQAGKEASGEVARRQNQSSGDQTQHEAQLEKHSLPGMNQAGKGPDHGEPDQEDRRDETGWPSKHDAPSR